MINGEKRGDLVRLPLWSELAGTCIDVTVNDVFTSIQVNKSVLRYINESIEAKIIQQVRDEAVGRTIGILHNDNPVKPIVIRFVNENNTIQKLNRENKHH
jgi:hypothetical protein